MTPAEIIGRVLNLMTPIHSGLAQEQYDHKAQIIITALEKEGYVIVPKEPTADMALAGARSIGKTMHLDNYTIRSSSCYQAMIGAAK